MAKRNSQLTELLVVAQDDYLTIVDTSAGQSKRVSVKNLTGLPDVGWTATGESWTFSSWDAARRIGVITVPTDATVKYSLGNRIRIAQSTGGTKYGIIHYITATALHVFFPVGTTLNNEAINTPVYSPLYSPVGFNPSAALWSLESVLNIDTNVAATQNVVYNLGSHSLAVGAGVWKAYGKVVCGLDRAAVGRTDTIAGLSTSASSFTDMRLVGGQASGNGGIFSAGSITVTDDITFTSASTLYWLTSPTAGTPQYIYNFGAGSIGGSRIIRVTSSFV